MNELVRRSNLMLPVTAANGKAGVSKKDEWPHVPDAVTLDLEDGVPEPRKLEARALVREAIPRAAHGAAEVFVRVNKPYLYADLEASIWPGLTGIMLPDIELANDVAQAAHFMEEIEHKRGIEVGSLQIIVLLESGLAVWNVREILAASPRVSQVALDEGDLCYSMGINPSEEYDPLVYVRGRMVIEGIAAGVQPLGMAHPLGSLSGAPSRDEILRLATVGKNLGTKGVICPDPIWIEPVNTAFTPTEGQVDYYTQVREVFAQAVAAGTAAVPFAGRMIDVPVDVWANAVLERAAQCKARDEEKRVALEGSS